MSATPRRGRAGSADPGPTQPDALRGPLRGMLLVAMTLLAGATVIALII